MAFAIEFERESDLSLAISANVLRVLDERGVRVQDLPLLTGVSKEAIQMAMGVLEKKSIVVVEPDPNGSRAKLARLTNNGKEAQAAYHHLLGIIEQRWRERFGEDNIRALRQPLERLNAAWGSRFAVVPWIRAPPRRLACVGTQAHDPAPLSHGAAPRRIP